MLKRLTKRAIVFDKDGTLIKFDSKNIIDWVTKIQNNIYRSTDKNIDLHNFWQTNPINDKSPVAWQNSEQLYYSLIQHSKKYNIPESIIKKSFIDFPHLNNKPVCNIKSLFSELYNKNIKIAICTSDSRNSTKQFIEQYSINNYIDFILCGDDKCFSRKPLPNNLYLISNVLNVPCNEMLMIGDTTVDMKMTCNTDVLPIGVLTGIGIKKDLNKYTNIIINSCDNLIK